MLCKIKKIFAPHALPRLASGALLMLRIAAGVAFALHGWIKIQHPFNWMNMMNPQATTPSFLQALAAVSEFGGGLAWVVGLLTPLASLGIFCTMSVAVQMLMQMNAPWVPTGMGMSYELPLLYALIALVLIFVGPGRYSLDYLIFKAKCCPHKEAATQDA